MKHGSINSGSLGKGANQAPAVGVSAPSEKVVSTTAPKTDRPAAGANQSSNKVSAPRGEPAASKPKALEKPVRTPTKAEHNVRVRKKDHNSQAHKQALAKKGEDATRRVLRQGKEYNSFHSMKHNAIHGIDLAALDRAKNGKIKRAAVVESKASRNRNLGPASFREQTTHKYVEKSLLKAKIKNVKHADKLYELAKDRKLHIIGSAYNKETGRVRLHKVYEPRTAKPEQSDAKGPKRKK